MRTCVLAVAALAVLLTDPALAAAQSRESHWGLQASFVPSWEVTDSFKMLFNAETVDLSGDDFRVGFARGRTLGGDWGVVYVRKTVKDGSVVFTEDGELRTTDDVIVSGFSVDKFASFVTIAERVQIGMGVGGGIGWARGDVTQLDSSGVETIEAKRLFNPFGGELEFVPLGKVDVGVAGILAPGMKIRASAGFNYPGTTVFTITGVFLFGAR